MSLTLLLDLDDTLLTNEMRTFLPAYLQALSKALSPYAPPDELIHRLIAATRLMAANHLPNCTLQEIFEAAFYPSIGWTAADLQPALERFYAEDFPRLERIIQPRPEAVALVKEAFQRGYRVAISTNPLFPRTAILQRLAWAGLSPNDFHFDLITSYETFHFAKPNPAYFAEVLARLGWPEDQVVVVGDDLENDIAASRALGLAAYWLSKPGHNPSTGELAPIEQGDLQSFFDWLDKTEPKTLTPDLSQPAALLAILRATPAAFDYFCRPLTPGSWRKRPAPNEWAPVEILAHLRDVEAEVNLPRIQHILSVENPFLPGMDTDPWAETRRYIDKNGPQALNDFTHLRMTTLELLNSISPQDWSRRARHAILGPTELSELINIVASHDRLHIHQIHRNLSG